MTVRRGLFVQPTDDAEPVGTTPVDARIDLAGLLTPAGDLGVVAGVLSGLTVTGTASGWAYQVTAGHAVTTRGATDGAMLLAVDGNTLTPAPVLANGDPGSVAAPVSGSRYEMIWILQRDLDAAEADNVAKLGVTQGTASGSPTRPDVPPGALVLAEALIPSGAANTAAGSVTLTRLAPKVSTRGGIITASSVPTTVLGTPTDGVWLDVAGVLYRGNGTVWTRVTGLELPHLRVRATAPRTLTAGQWGLAPINATADSSGDASAFVLNTTTNQVTVVAAGLYHLDAVISGGLSTFAVQIRNAVTGEVLVQGPTGSGASMTNQASVMRRLAAGVVLDVRAYPSGAMNVVADTIATPTYLAVTKMSG